MFFKAKYLVLFSLIIFMACACSEELYNPGTLLTEITPTPTPLPTNEIIPEFTPVQFGSSFNESSNCVAVDGGGNVYIAGYTYGQFGSYQNQGEADMFLIKHSNEGAFIWVRMLGTSAFDIADAVAVDDSGYVYILGRTYADIDGSGSNPWLGESDIVVAKYSPSGDLIWILQDGTPAHEFGSDLALDDTGNIYVTGRTTGVIGNENFGFQDWFIIKYDNNGTRIWETQLGTDGSDYPFGLAVDGAGQNIYVTGVTSSNFVAGAYSGQGDFVIVKLNSGGNLVWADQIGTQGQERGLSIDIDKNGDVYACGYTDDDMDGSGSNIYHGARDVFIVKYSPTGSLQWIMQIGDSLNQEAFSIATDQTGNIYLTGYSDTDFAENVMFGESEIFLMKLDSTGQILFTEVFGTSTIDIAYKLDIDYAGYVFITGMTEGSLFSDTYGDSDYFLFKLSPDGVPYL